MPTHLAKVIIACYSDAYTFICVFSKPQFFFFLYEVRKKRKNTLIYSYRL